MGENDNTTITHAADLDERPVGVTDPKDPTIVREGTNSESTTVYLHLHASDYEKTDDRTDITKDHVEDLTLASLKDKYTSGATILDDTAETADNETGEDHVKSVGSIVEEDSKEIMS